MDEEVAENQAWERRRQMLAATTFGRHILDQEDALDAEFAKREPPAYDQQGKKGGRYRILPSGKKQYEPKAAAEARKAKEAAAGGKADSADKATPDAERKPSLEQQAIAADKGKPAEPAKKEPSRITSKGDIPDHVSSHEDIQTKHRYANIADSGRIHSEAKQHSELAQQERKKFADTGNEIHRENAEAHEHQVKRADEELARRGHAPSSISKEQESKEADRLRTLTPEQMRESHHASRDIANGARDAQKAAEAAGDRDAANLHHRIASVSEHAMRMLHEENAVRNHDGPAKPDAVSHEEHKAAVLVAKNGTTQSIKQAHDSIKKVADEANALHRDAKAAGHSGADKIGQSAIQLSHIQGVMAHELNRRGVATPPSHVTDKQVSHLQKTLAGKSVEALNRAKETHKAAMARETDPKKKADHSYIAGAIRQELARRKAKS